LLDDCSLSKGRWHEDDGDVGSGGGHRLGDGSEHWEVLALNGYSLAGLAGVDATNDVGATCEHALGVLHALGTGHALDDDL